jgi:Rps23 Pro-64 3,4-dihydroxylase Tpa1-like proline 4-hydroxylase
MYALVRRLATAMSGSSPAVSIDYADLMRHAGRCAEPHANARPYAHTSIDNFLPQKLADAVAREVPKPSEPRQWDRYFAAGYEDKWAISDDPSLPPLTRDLVREMNSSLFLQFLERLTGIEHLLPDPHLEGAGIHLVPSGGVLQIHADFNYSKRLNAYRRVNVFLYLNPRWDASWGGALELWDAPHGSAQATFAPQFNRLVVFNSRSDTFHGHPHPITAPKTEWRTSLAMYYYTAERPETEPVVPHNTIYKGLHI